MPESNDIVGQASLRRAVKDYVDHYHQERNHQGLDNRLLRTSPRAKGHVGTINCHTRLGGMLSYYYRMAA
jgi:putative transposase